MSKSFKYEESFVTCHMGCRPNNTFTIISVIGTVKLDNGSIVNGSARKSDLAMLHPLHNQGLGAFMASSVASLYFEADEPSLTTRREKLSLQYAIRIAENQSNQAHEVTFPPKYTDLYENKPNYIKSFGVRILPLFELANINHKNIDKNFTPNIPAWCMQTKKISLSYIRAKSLKQVFLS